MPKASSKACPNCLLDIPESTRQCTCGWDFRSGTLERPRETGGVISLGQSPDRGRVWLAISLALVSSIIFIIFLLFQHQSLKEELNDAKGQVELLRGQIQTIEKNIRDMSVILKRSEASRETAEFKNEYKMEDIPAGLDRNLSVK